MFIEGSASTIAATGATFSANRPNNAPLNNLLLAFQSTAYGIGSAPAAPTGWTQVTRDSTAQFDLACWYKISNGAEPTTYTFNNDAGVGSVAHVWMISIHGAALGTPDVSSHGTGTSTSATASSVTTTTASELLFGAFAIGLNTGETITPVGFSGSFGTLSNISTKLNVAQVGQNAAGASGDKTATISNSAAWVALLVALSDTNVGGGGSTGSPLGLYHKLRTVGGWILRKRVGRKLR